MCRFINLQFEIVEIWKHIITARSRRLSCRWHSNNNISSASSPIQFGFPGICTAIHLEFPCIIDWMNDRTNERMNEWIDEWISIQLTNKIFTFSGHRNMARNNKKIIIFFFPINTPSPVSPPRRGAGKKSAWEFLSRRVAANRRRRHRHRHRHCAFLFGVRGDFTIEFNNMENVQKINICGRLLLSSSFLLFIWDLNYFISFYLQNWIFVFCFLSNTFSFLGYSLRLRSFREAAAVAGGAACGFCTFIEFHVDAFIHIPLAHSYFHWFVLITFLEIRFKWNQCK